MIFAEQEKKVNRQTETMAREVIMGAAGLRERAKMQVLRRRARMLLATGWVETDGSLLLSVGPLTPDSLTPEWRVLFSDLVELYGNEPFQLTLEHAEAQALESVLMLHLAGVT